MDSAFSILMFIFGGCIFLFGLQVYFLKKPFLPMRVEVSMKKTVGYRKYLGKVLMLVSLAPCVSGAIGLLGGRFLFWAGIVLIFSFIALITLGIKIFHE